MTFPAYDDYKQSGLPLAGDVPKHWTVTPLKWCLRRDGYKAGPFGSSLITSSLLDEGEISVLTPEHVATQSLNVEFDLYLPPERDEEMSGFRVGVGDVVLPIVGSLGRAMIVREPINAIINQRLARISPDPSKLLPDYLVALIANDSYFKKLDEVDGRGAIISHITKEVLLNRDVVLPPVDEQRALLDFLDVETSKIDGLVSEQRRLIELLKEKRQAVISHAVTKGLNPNAPMKPSGIQWLGDVPQHWTVVRLRRVGDIGQGCAFAHAIQGQELGEVPWFKVKDMNRAGNEIEMLRADNYVSHHLAQEIGVTIFPKGTVIFPRVGAALLTNKRRILSCSAIIDDNVYGFKPEKVHSRFLYLILLLVDMAKLCSPGLV